MKTYNSGVIWILWMHFLSTFPFRILKAKRWKNRNRKKTFEEPRGSEESNLSAKDLRQQLQAEKRLNKDEIYPVKKVWSLECTSVGMYQCLELPISFEH